MYVAAKSITGKVVDTKHVGTSTMGNPSYDVSIELTTIDGEPVGGTDRIATVRTQSNSMIAYGITNPEYRDNMHEYTLTRAGRISHVRAV